MTAAAQQITTADSYNPIKGQTFNPTPRHVQRRTDLSLGTKAVYGYLCGCYGKDGLVCPKQSTIARETGLSRRQVGRCVNTLENVGLISVLRTGRASYYKFIEQEVSSDFRAPQRTLPETASDFRSETISPNLGRSQRTLPDHSPDLGTPSKQSPCPIRCDTMSHTPAPAPIKEKKIQKKTTTAPRVVVSLGNDSDIRQALEAIPENHRTPSTEKIVKISLASHSLEDVMKAISYTNHRARKNYGAYLSLTLKHNYADDWTPPEVQTARIQNEVLEDIRIHKEVQEDAMRAMSERQRMGSEWLSRCQSERSKFRDHYMKICSRFEQRRARKMTDEKLSQAVGFQMFLVENSDVIQNAKTFDIMC